MNKSFYCYLIRYSSGSLTLHLQGCSHLNEGENRIFLGSVYKDFQAMNLAKRHSCDVSTCPDCMGKYH